MGKHTEQETERPSALRARWSRFMPPVLGLAVLSAIVLGPFWLSSWVSGFLESAWLRILLDICVVAGAAWILFRATVQCFRDTGKKRRDRTVLWLSLSVTVVVAFALNWSDLTPSHRELFGRGLLRRVELQTDVESIRVWLGSMDPNDCAPVPHSGNPNGRYISKEARPETLKDHGDWIQLEFDAAGRPSVRLVWFQGKAGTFGLVIGSIDMETPPSEPGMYGQTRTELRPGIYFWYEEA